LLWTYQNINIIQSPQFIIILLVRVITALIILLAMVVIVMGMIKNNRR